MPLDYLILLIVAVVAIGGGLFVLREAKKYCARRDMKRQRQARRAREQKPGIS